GCGSARSRGRTSDDRTRRRARDHRLRPGRAARRRLRRPRRDARVRLHRTVASVRRGAGAGMNVLYERDGAVATLTLNRPEALNAWTPALGGELLAAVERASADDAVRAVLVR